MGSIHTPEQGSPEATGPVFANWGDPLMDAFRDAKKALKPIARDLADLEEMRRELWAQHYERIADAIDIITPAIMGKTVEVEVIHELGDPPTIGIYERRVSSYQVTPFSHIWGGPQQGYVRFSNPRRKYSVPKASGKVIGADVPNMALILHRGPLNFEAYVVRLIHPQTGERLVNLGIKQSRRSQAEDLQ